MIRLRHTIYDMMPVGMQRFMDDCDNSERGRVLKVFSELTERSGFDSELYAVNEALVHGGTDPDSLRSLYNRLYADVLQLPSTGQRFSDSVSEDHSLQWQRSEKDGCRP